MDDLNELVQSGFYFGPGNPGNWGQDLLALCGDTSESEQREIIRLALLEAAKLHSANW